MKIVRFAFVAALATLAIVPAAQAQQRQQQQAAQPAKKMDKTFPLGKNWLAVSLNGKPFGGRERPAFTLDQQFRARGFAGCNTFSAVAFPLRDQGIAVGPLALTHRSCDKSLMALETAFLSALRYSQKWDIVGGQLVIKGPSGELVFDRSI